MSNINLKIAAFGFRYIPPHDGAAGADKFALELYSRIVQQGHKVTAYNRVYKKQNKFKQKEYKGIYLHHFYTLPFKGFDTFIHSFLSTIHIIIFNTGSIVHIHNGGNSIWAIFLRLCRKKVFVSQDGIDWKRSKWPWYGKIFLSMASVLTAYIPNKVIFDNKFAKELFEKKFGKKYEFIPYGSEVKNNTGNSTILNELDLKLQDYLLFVGRFIPDKGLHYLISAYEKIETDKKLVLVGGSPNKSDYEKKLKKSKDKRIIFPGYIYGDDTICLIKNAYAYIQPSDFEGLSPVILTVMGLGTPLVCSDIQENIYIVENLASTFQHSDVKSLKNVLEYCLNNPILIRDLAKKAKDIILHKYNWDIIANQHINLFLNNKI